ncbi:Trans-resveratrol di-O-methyltransferase [Vitis vinifera]|uniref:Trans-resveratrol di-O-methyltransferase n=1 Tax=Vitis vinifera TaxID=29760 RepID=A0A438GYQ7_VITVI|nr:Trans-resveratrol di-O-methyltransferase [Vitis vinifera]
MDLANGEISAELLHAQAHVWNHIFNFIKSMSLKCATQLGIPDIIHNHGKPMTLPELVAKLPVHPKRSQCDVPSHAHSCSFWLPCCAKSPTSGHFGIMPATKPQLNNSFNEAMASDARLLTSVLLKEARAYLRGLNSLVDVGGGTGKVAKAIANAFPHLNCTVLDLSHVVAACKGART